MRPLPAFAAAVRRKLLAQPGITALPLCGACGHETDPRHFGREFCRSCEAERRAMSETWEREQWELTHPGASFPLPSDPMFGSDAAVMPFLADEEAV